jgi:hypothetical protein
VFWGYVTICTVIVTLILCLTAYSQVTIQLRKAELPNGTYLNRVHLFSEYDDVVLRHPSGRILVPHRIEFVCFNDVYVMGWRHGPAHRSLQFIYRKGDDEAVFVGAQFDQMRKESGLCDERGSRPADEVTWIGYGILVKDKRYRREWYE